MLKRSRDVAFFVILSFVASSAVAEQCRLALALAFDVSGSVDGGEYRLQMRGMAEALGDAEVQEALFAVPGVPVALAAYEWSASSYQQMIVDWTLLADAVALEGVREQFANWKRRPAPEATGLGVAMDFGMTLLERAPRCWDRTLDISADGENNNGLSPGQLKASGRIDGLRVNALVVAWNFQSFKKMTEDSIASLASYFLSEVIQGQDAFVEVAVGYDDYARAMKRKLLRELTIQAVEAPGLESDRRLVGLHSGDL
ncbi:DUF1194 domain-containing protein [Tropicimonas sp. IMCC6043]|uniref:DUF1194 domain-containing protein n=1 Tax=Tropicimonas sp. IMCC6043 TaxID=2510645 RepID=UPI00101CFB1C|nr:DUF1194 domain-containing protein [Tropicimonas sp. IMCC6043]RYH06367.1 DUF1194 domain-containing protein [Tropicimonas sp. IMCC6043]